MTEPSVPPRSDPADADALAGAVELARAAAVETAGDRELVGEHLGAAPEPVAPETDEVSPEAHQIGAINTVVFGPRMVGHNTDYWGFAESYRAQMAGARLDRVTVFGAGGAGSSVGSGP